MLCYEVIGNPTIIFCFSEMEYRSFFHSHYFPRTIPTVERVYYPSGVK
jgi:hypothetical protein